MKTDLAVVDPRMVRVLLAEQGLTYIEPYFGATRSISDAATWTGTSLHRTYYWTKRLHEVGLIRVVKVTPRAGRPIRHYRAVADSFRVDAGALPVGWFESMMTLLNKGLVRSFEAVHPEIVIDSDVWIHRGAHASGLTVERVPGTSHDGPPDALQSSFTARLSPADAARFQAELAQLRDRWVAQAAPPSSGYRTYLTMLALAPLAPEDQ